MIWPSFPPVIISAAITNVYKVIAVWIPVTVVPTSLATVAIDTFITELSSVIRNCAEASVSNTIPAAPAAPSAAGSATTSRLESIRPAQSRRKGHQAHHHTQWQLHITHPR